MKKWMMLSDVWPIDEKRLLEKATSIVLKTSDGKCHEMHVVSAETLTRHASTEELMGVKTCKFCGKPLGRKAVAAGDQWHRHCAAARPPQRKLNGAAVHAASAYKAFGRKGC